MYYILIHTKSTEKVIIGIYDSEDKANIAKNKYTQTLNKSNRYKSKDVDLEVDSHLNIELKEINVVENLNYGYIFILNSNPSYFTTSFKDLKERNLKNSKYSSKYDVVRINDIRFKNDEINFV